VEREGAGSDRRVERWRKGGKEGQRGKEGWRDEKMERGRGEAREEGASEWEGGKPLGADRSRRRQVFGL